MTKIKVKYKSDLNTLDTDLSPATWSLLWAFCGKIQLRDWTALTHVTTGSHCTYISFQGSALEYVVYHKTPCLVRPQHVHRPRGCFSQSLQISLRRIKIWSRICSFYSCSTLLYMWYFLCKKNATYVYIINYWGSSKLAKILQINFPNLI